MNKHQVAFTLNFTESYLPPRCRKLRYRDASMEAVMEFDRISPDEAPLVLCHLDWNCDTYVKDYRLWKGRLFTRANYSHFHAQKRGWAPVSALNDYMAFIGRSTDRVVGMKEALQTVMDRVHLLIIDDEVWEETGEPRYVIYTFGLGHNHGETCLCIDNSYNSNISKDCYFSALEYEKAVQACVKVALERGDTDSVESVRNCSARIEVLDPSVIKLNPQKEHGDGNPILKKMEAVCCAMPDASAAAAFLMSETAVKMAKASE